MSLRIGLTAFIFARGGSKRVPRKNTVPVAGKPLIAHSIISALASRFVNNVIVSTDDLEIAAIASDFGASVLKRPIELASDASSEILSWRHAIQSTPELFSGSSPQPFISLPATAPLRSPDDVDAAISKFENGAYDVLFGISPSHNSPYLNMVETTQEGRLRLVIGGHGSFRSQDAPQVYDVTTSTYVASADYIMTCDRLMQGRVGYVIIPVERALDVDTPFDMHLADLLLRHPFKPNQP